MAKSKIIGYSALIKEVSTGAIAPSARYPYEWVSDFWWSEGNFSCDCNRAMEFDRACGKPEDQVRDFPCGLNSPRSFLVHITADDGTVLYSEFQPSAP